MKAWYGQVYGTGRGSVGLSSTVPIPNKEAFDEQITVKDSHESYVLKKIIVFLLFFCFSPK